MVGASVRPGSGAVLHVRDRLYEAWHAFTELGTTGNHADRPLVAPPAWRLDL